MGKDEWVRNEELSSGGDHEGILILLLLTHLSLLRGALPHPCQENRAGGSLANSSLPCWQTAVLAHLHSSSSTSHLILEELGLVLTTSQSLNKAKDLGINTEKRQDRSNVSGWRPPMTPHPHFHRGILSPVR